MKYKNYLIKCERIPTDFNGYNFEMNVYNQNDEFVTGLKYCSKIRNPEEEASKVFTLKKIKERINKHLEYVSKNNLVCIH